MIIEFKDPGYDWTTLIVIGCILGVILLVAGAFELLYRYRGERSNAGLIAQITLLVAAGWLVLGGMVGSIVAQAIYFGERDKGLYRALEAEGFEGIRIEQIDYAPDGFSALLDGEPFSGTIEKLDYPEDYTYIVVEREKK